MNIININYRTKSKPKITQDLFAKMEHSLKTAQIDFEKSIRLAKTLAPILSDQTSNQRHLDTINHSSSVQEKVIAILMLGFPNNRAMLPTLQQILSTGSEALRIASAMAIYQMRDGQNNIILKDILLTAYQNEHSAFVKKAIAKRISQLAIPQLHRNSGSHSLL